MILAVGSIVFAQEEQREPPRPAPPQLMRRMPAEGAVPPVLYIECERVQPGKLPEHTKAVKDVLRLCDRENWPLHVITLSGVTADEGEMTFLVAFDSFAGIDRLEGAIGSSPKSALDELERLESQESATHAAKHTLLAIYRPDLSYRPDVAAFGKATLVSSSQHVVRFGHQAEYESDVHFLDESFAKANVDIHDFVYQVISGAPHGTFIRLEPLRSFADWDAYGQQLQAVMQGLDDAGKQRLGNLFKDSVIQSAGDPATPLTRLWAIQPDQSRVSDGFAANNPAFWRPKPAPAAKPAAKPEGKPKQP